MKIGTQMQLYIRRWRPSQFVLDPYQEVVLDTANPDELKRRVKCIFMISQFKCFNVYACRYLSVAAFLLIKYQLLRLVFIIHGVLFKLLLLVGYYK